MGARSARAHLIETAARRLELASTSVREWLGHTDISTTGRYLAVTAESLKRTFKRPEDARKIRPVRRRSAPSWSTSLRIN